MHNELESRIDLLEELLDVPGPLEDYPCMPKGSINWDLNWDKEKFTGDQY